MPLIFAYGSNLDLAQMLRRCPSARFRCRATLPGYALAFAGSSGRWGGGAVATILGHPRAKVHGVVYSVSETDLFELDRCEGHPHVYCRERIHVRPETGGCLLVQAYMLDEAYPPNTPAAAYVSAIRRGYKHWGLPAGSLARAVARCRNLDRVPSLAYES